MRTPRSRAVHRFVYLVMAALFGILIGVIITIAVVDAIGF